MIPSPEPHITQDAHRIIDLLEVGPARRRRWNIARIWCLGLFVSSSASTGFGCGRRQNSHGNWNALRIWRHEVRGRYCTGQERFHTRIRWSTWLQTRTTDWPFRLGGTSEGIYIELPASPLCGAGVWSCLFPKISTKLLCNRNRSRVKCSRGKSPHEIFGADFQNRYREHDQLRPVVAVRYENSR
ncbi:hypothetical protein BDR22DRAFT_831849 [Usnea florida]